MCRGGVHRSPGGSYWSEDDSLGTCEENTMEEGISTHLHYMVEQESHDAWAVRRSERTPLVPMEVCFVLAWAAWQSLRHPIVLSLDAVHGGM